jgi:hypothetical protein
VALAKYLNLSSSSTPSPWASLHLLIFFYSYRFLLTHAISIQAGSFYLDFLLSMEIIYVYLLYKDLNNMMIQTGIDMYKTVTVCKK